MSLMSKITKGKVKKPLAAMIHAPDGVGKTSFAASAPSPIFIVSEKGTESFDVARFPLASRFDDLTSAIKELATQPHDFKTVAIDSLDWFEPLLYRDICADSNVKSIEKAAGGYGKGYVEATRIWGLIKDQLEELRTKRGMNVILIAHSQIVTFMEPATGFSYQRYELKLHKSAAAMWREWCDVVLFANYELFTSNEGKHTRTVSDGARIMYTERRPGWDAKNRFGLPLKLDLSWDTLTEALDSANPESMEAVQSRIAGMLMMIADEKFKEIVVDTINKAGDNVTKLNAIANRLALRLGNE